jgi:hypothetical protein
MTTRIGGRSVAGWLLGVALAIGSATQAQDEPAQTQTPDQRFEARLADAQRDPEKADWVALRHAFAETTHYNPYNFGYRDELGKIGRLIEDGKLDEAEADLTKLLERERFMRLDAQTLAAMLYDKKGDKEKAQEHRRVAEAISETLFVPGRGESFEKPIEVLFIEEEYLVLGTLGLRPESQALARNDEHWFDVFTIAAQGEKPERKFYFNIDRPRAALSKSLGSLLERARKDEEPDRDK